MRHDPTRPPVPLYLIVFRDLHPAAIANGNKIRTPRIGEDWSPNHFPHLDRASAERHANHINAKADHHFNAYVIRHDPTN